MVISMNKYKQTTDNRFTSNLKHCYFLTFPFLGHSDHSLTLSIDFKQIQWSLKDVASRAPLIHSFSSRSIGFTAFKEK